MSETYEKITKDVLKITNTSENEVSRLQLSKEKEALMEKINLIDKKLAVLCERMANSQKIQADINIKIEKHIDQSEKRMRNLENCKEKTETKIDDNKDEIDRLRSKSNIIDVLLGLASLIAGYLGINNK